MSKKWCASTIGIAGILLFAIPAITAASQSQTQPRDPRPAPRQSAASREQGLKAATVANPANVTAWIELAQLQEARGATDEAERTFKAALSATGGARTAGVDVGVLQPSRTVRPDDRRARAGRSEESDGRRRSPACSCLLFRQGEQGSCPIVCGQTDVRRRRHRRDRSRHRAESRLRRGPHVQEPPAPSEGKHRGRLRPPPGHDQVDGQQPVRVGGNIKTPTKIHDVRPVYPQEALDVRVSGMVILEAVIDIQGNVRSARVLRSIPLLDQAAVDAVKQWRFTPTLLEGVAVPVLMTVTVNFTMQ